MKIEDIAPIEVVIHKQRLCEEMMFQRMVTTPCLKECSVRELKELCHSLWIIISNNLYRLESNGTKCIVTDTIANDPNFVNDMISQFFIEEVK